jgi:hypothetical protein
MSAGTVEVELRGGPADGRRVRVHAEARALRVPVVVARGSVLERYVDAERRDGARVFRHVPERST